MQELKIYERGHWGYAAIVAGGILGLLAIATILLSIQSGKDFSFTWVLIAGSILLIIKGVRESGKPLVYLGPDHIEFWHKKKRVGVPLANLEKVAFRDTSLWIKASSISESVEIPLHRVKAEKREELKAALRPLDIGDEPEGPAPA